MSLSTPVGSSYLVQTPSRFRIAKPPAAANVFADEGETTESIGAAMIG